jgi:hypothetical protein
VCGFAPGDVLHPEADDDVGAGAVADADAALDPQLVQHCDQILSHHLKSLKSLKSSKLSSL